jgi:hypothetical protein
MIGTLQIYLKVSHTQHIIQDWYPDIFITYFKILTGDNSHLMMFLCLFEFS